MSESNPVIKEIALNSLADQLGLEPGDRVEAINGVRLVDLIDYLILGSEDKLNLTIVKKSGDLWEIELTKEPDEPLGITFSDILFDGIRSCINHCLFCFVHQLPGGQRPTLYIQDDDYRLSFLQGSYVTLTNLDDKDWQRICDLHLSPLYISVHATDPLVRQRLLGCKAAGGIMDQLQRLAEAGIQVHTQLVLCPDINDGLVLEQTVKDLAGLWPAVASIAVVPVGLTGHRTKLVKLRPYQPDEARQIIELVESYQKLFWSELGTRLVFPADEWYIIAGMPIPDAEFYEDYLQLDNGVGLIRWFLTEFTEIFPDFVTKLNQFQGKLIIITGLSAIGMWRTVQEVFAEKCPKLRLVIMPVINHFLGTTVTVTGLLSGRDILEQVNHDPASGPAVYLLPQIVLKQDEPVFLDGLSLTELQEACRPRELVVVPSQAGAWLDWLVENLSAYFNKASGDVL